MGKRRSDPLRTLARSVCYQNLYSMAKELSCVQIFENVSDFTKIQMEFLYWVALYNRLYCEVAVKDNKYLTVEIIENDFWLDCYLIWERIKKPEIDNKENNSRSTKKKSRTPSIVFTSFKKK